VVAVSLGVTITGADDEVEPSQLALLSAEFDFVEWGILFSRTRYGSPRYPTLEWSAAAMKTPGRPRPGFEREHCYAGDAPRQRISPGGLPPRFSAHLCGYWSSQARAGEALPLSTAELDRVQINGFELGDEHGVRLIAPNSPPFILQCRAVDRFEAFCAAAAKIGHGAAVLYDPSGGKGKAQAWPKELRSNGVSFGIAGGIGPDNVDHAIAAARRLGASWIDMESGVRTDDRFDLDKVCQVLERAARAGAAP
jgi:N-(5'phosphoribosyl)anthranilate (PRA) isomerase